MTFYNLRIKIFHNFLLKNHKCQSKSRVVGLPIISDIKDF